MRIGLTDDRVVRGTPKQIAAQMKTLALVSNASPSPSAATVTQTETWMSTEITGS